MKYILIIIGTVSLILGITGIIIPGLPTTPFLLLTAALYAKSSPRLYKKLSEHKILGEYLTSFKKGMTRKTKIYSIAMMWAMILFSAFIIFSNMCIRATLLTIATLVTIYLIRLPKRVEEE